MCHLSLRINFENDSVSIVSNRKSKHNNIIRTCHIFSKCVLITNFNDCFINHCKGIDKYEHLYSNPELACVFKNAIKLPCGNIISDQCLNFQTTNALCKHCFNLANSLSRHFNKEKSENQKYTPNIYLTTSDKNKKLNQLSDELIDTKSQLNILRKKLKKNYLQLNPTTKN